MFLRKFFKENPYFFHWIGLIGFFGSVTTALAANYFFSKEAIVNSFTYSFSVIGLDSVNITDRLFIARIARRATWHWHFYSGLLLFLSFAIFYAQRGKFDKLLDKVKLFFLFIIFSSGAILYARLYIKISPDTFYYLKIFHHDSVYIFIVIIFFHMIEKIRNRKEK